MPISIPTDCWGIVVPHLSYTDLISLSLTCKDINRLVVHYLFQKSNIIKTNYLHFLKGRKMRIILLRQHFSELYNFKPFVISLILDKKMGKTEMLRRLKMYEKKYSLGWDSDQSRSTDLKIFLQSLTLRQLQYLR